MRFARSTIEYVAALTVISVLLLNAGVFAYSSRTSGTLISSSSPLDNKHNSSSQSTHATHTSTQDSTQGGSQGDQNGNQQGNDSNGNGNGNQGNGNGNQGNGNRQQLHFTLYTPSNTNNGKDDRGQATIAINGTTLNIDISVKKTSASATFSVVLVAIPIQTTSSTTASTTTVFSTTMFSTTIFSTTAISSSSTTSSATSCTGSIGTFLTDGNGEGEAQLSTTLVAGTYALGLVLCSNNAPVLVSHPTTIVAVVPQGSGGNGKAGNDQGQNDKVNTVTKSSQDDSEIRAAMSDKTIPAVISVVNSDVSMNQLDSRFSVSASKLSADGLMISISAQNVTGSRVLLVNLTGSQWSASSLQSLKVAFDGAPISQAASLSQIFNSTTTDPARYIIMLTSSGLQLLVSIPHFSLHTIQLIPTAVPTTGFTSLDATILGVALVAFAALSVVYLKRTKVHFRPITRT